MKNMVMLTCVYAGKHKIRNAISVTAPTPRKISRAALLSRKGLPSYPSYDRTFELECFFDPGCSGQKFLSSRNGKKFTLRMSFFSGAKEIFIPCTIEETEMLTLRKRGQVKIIYHLVPAGQIRYH